MKLFTKLFFLLIILSNSACSGDDACTQADWIGTYTLTSDTDCEIDESTSITFEETLVITAGTTDDEIVVDGDAVTFTECSASVFFATMSLDGDKLTLTALTCVGDYDKN